MTESSSMPPPTQYSLALGIAPSGHLHLDIAPGAAGLLAPAVAAALSEAFGRGTGSGLLQLAAAELADKLANTLPPSLAFGRELAHVFMKHLCASNDLATAWATLDLPLPRAELTELLAGAPLMTGAEYLDQDCLDLWWSAMQAAVQGEIAAADGDALQWLAKRHPGWNSVGRVCFHLAENKANEDAPFAFLATYAAGLSQQAKVQHLPLARALQEHAGSEQRAALLQLLLPLQRASEQCGWLKVLLDSGAIFQPIAWTPREAHLFLQAIPLFEACGIVVRIPDWWQRRNRQRPQVKVNIGKSAAGMGLAAMMDFDISFALGEQALTTQEWEQLLAAGSSLVRFKGNWVEVDKARLDAVLAHWQQVQREVNADGDGISFINGMRLLAGAAPDTDNDDALPAAEAPWSSVVAGDWLRSVLDELQGSHSDKNSLALPELKAQLRPYQQDGVHWLWFLNRLGLGGCLADDMGLGKTVQVLALLLMAKRAADPGPHLLVVPASLIGNWQAEMARFAPSLRLLIAHPSALPAKTLATLNAAQLMDVDVVITSYGSLIRLPWLQETRWAIAVLDEAQAIKNPAARQSRAVKALKSRVRFALTGTPVENRLGDLWSLFDFICPGLLGSDKAFSRFVRKLEQGEGAAPTQTHTPDYTPLRKLVQPYILRRLKSDKSIIADLPDKTEVKAYCILSRLQLSLYQDAVAALAHQIATVDGIARRGLVLAFLMRFKQICNHPSQWLGDGSYLPADGGKFARLREIAEEIAMRQQKVLVFTQFQEMTGPLAAFLETVFGRPGCVLHGNIPVKARKALVDQFQQEQGPPFFVLSIKAGGTGLNLTAASHVIHFDRWWNPAVENQATDRAYRIGQKRNVLVHKFICRGTIEEKIDRLIEAKMGMSNEILSGGGETLLTEMSNEALLQLVALDIHHAKGM